MPLPNDCVETAEAAPANLLRIVRHQKEFYHLSLQRMVRCRTTRRFPHSEPDFTNAVFSEEVRKRWLPLYVGCCSYQFGRHVAVVVVHDRSSGSLVLEAVLIQSRWDYLQQRGGSPWRWLAPLGLIVAIPTVLLIWFTLIRPVRSTGQ
jgi:hypothetical protein